MAKIYRQTNPVLVDSAIDSVQTRLAELTWLDTVFGRAYKHTEHSTENGKHILPAAYVGDSEYVSLLPSDSFGNFAWFDVYEPQYVDSAVPGKPAMDFDMAVVVWFDIRTIFGDTGTIRAEEVKKDILDKLTAPGAVRGRLSVTRIYESPEFIYKGYSLERAYDPYAYRRSDTESMDKQYFMHPYYGFRFEVKIKERSAVC